MKKTDVFRSRVRTSVFGRSGYLLSVDALELATSLRSEIADVVFVDPPFNLGKDYGVPCDLEQTDCDTYERYLSTLLVELVRVLTPGGALFLYHLPYWATRLGFHLQEQLEFRHWIAVSMKNGFARGERLYPAHYSLLYFTKGTPRVFTRPRTAPAKCRHCGELVKDYGGYRSIIEQQGINLSDVWDDLSPVRHPGKKHRAANQLPLLLTDRVMQMAGRRNGLLIDPFSGSGTALVSGLNAGMRFVGNDISPRNIMVCRNRLEDAHLATNGSARNAHLNGHRVSPKVSAQTVPRRLPADRTQQREI